MILIWKNFIVCLINLNLLSNTLKFTSTNGNIFVTLTYNHKDLSISVWDTGIGIPKDKS
ncbi:MAG: hypothetical protein KIC66_13815 [Clostridium sp.]|nr:hypothetical protein [Clostridium sp.]